MKLISAGLFLLFALFCCASCSHRSLSSPKRIDSLVNAKVQPIIEQLRAQCDSSVMQAARMKADSILKAEAVRGATGHGSMK